MATRELDRFLIGKVNGARFTGGRTPQPMADTHHRFPVSDPVSTSPGALVRAVRRLRHVAGSGRIPSRGGYGERGGVYRGSFSATKEDNEDTSEATVTLTGPAALWAALMLTISRDAFGHDPRPQAADDARASIIACLDRVDPQWRERWNH